MWRQKGTRKLIYSYTHAENNAEPIKTGKYQKVISREDSKIN
jgi:hypothetical protein